MTVATKKLTVTEYFELERHSEIRHEYVNGTLIELKPGGSRTHSKIVKNIIKALDDLSDARGCELHAVDVMTQVAGERYRYPDIVISCAPGEDHRVLENPCFIAEVTSESTAETDHSVKLREYLEIPTLERYAIVSQSERLVLVFRREGKLSTFDTFSGSSEFEIPCLVVKLSLEQIYAGVVF